MSLLRRLRDFSYNDEGHAIQEKSKELVKLLKNEDAIKTLRKDAMQKKSKFVGIDRSGIRKTSFNSEENESFPSKSYDAYDKKPSYRSHEKHSSYEKPSSYDRGYQQKDEVDNDG